MRQSTKLWIGAVITVAVLSGTYAVLCDQKCWCALFPPKVIPAPCDSIAYLPVERKIYDDTGELRSIEKDSLPYRCKEYIFNRKHPDSTAIKKYLKDNCFIKVKSCDCAEGLELWRYAGTGTDPIGVTDPSKEPPGKKVGGLCPNYLIDLPKGINWTPINSSFPFDPENIFSTKLKCSSVSSVKVAITDTGIDTIPSNQLYQTLGWRRAPLSPICTDISSLYGINLLDPKTHPFDSTGHGTHVLGILLGIAPNAGNSKGVPFDLINIKMLEHKGDLFHALCGLYTAMEQGAQVINVSWGFRAPVDIVPSVLGSFIGDANNRGVMIVAGLGNDSTNLDKTDMKFWPACFAKDRQNVISVGAVDTLNYRLASFSNWASSDEMTLTAWGVDVPSTYPWNLRNSKGFARQSGTSMATPFVARTVAVMYGMYPNPSPGKIKEQIIKHASGSFRTHNHKEVIEAWCKNPPR